MKKTFEQIFPKKASIIKVPYIKVQKIRSFVDEVTKFKINNDSGHRIDNHKEGKRWFTGLLGEAAIEEYLGIEIINYNIEDSRSFSNPDLMPIGLSIGIKTSNYGNFPLISKNPRVPQIFLIRVTDDMLLLCGIGSVKILSDFSSDEFILDYRVKIKNVKTAFFGLDKLKTFKTINELKDIINETPK